MGSSMAMAEGIAPSEAEVVVLPGEATIDTQEIDSLNEGRIIEEFSKAGQPAFLPSVVSPSVRIKDIARFEGIRENQLTGLGLVVGLMGRETASAGVRMVANCFGCITIEPQDLRSRNIVAVMVTANLLPLPVGDQLM